jgi:hypothetical protein
MVEDPELVITRGASRAWKRAARTSSHVTDGGRRYNFSFSGDARFFFSFPAISLFSRSSSLSLPLRGYRSTAPSFQEDANKFSRFALSSLRRENFLGTLHESLESPPSSALDSVGWIFIFTSILLPSADLPIVFPSFYRRCSEIIIGRVFVVRSLSKGSKHYNRHWLELSFCSTVAYVALLSTWIIKASNSVLARVNFTISICYTSN